MGNPGTTDEPELSEIAGWSWGNDLCRPFVEQLPVTGASISVIGTLARRMTVCSSDTVAAQLEGLQFDLGEGPQWEVMKTGMPVFSPDLSLQSTSNWPVFGAAAALHRHAVLQAIHATRLATAGVDVGVDEAG